MVHILDITVHQTLLHMREGPAIQTHTCRPAAQPLLVALAKRTVRAIIPQDFSCKGTDAALYGKHQTPAQSPDPRSVLSYCAAHAERITLLPLLTELCGATYGVNSA